MKIANRFQMFWSYKIVIFLLVAEDDTDIGT